MIQTKHAILNDSDDQRGELRRMTWQDSGGNGAHDRQIDDDSENMNLAQLVNIDKPLDENDGDEEEHGQHRKGSPCPHETRAALPRTPPVICRAGHIGKSDISSLNTPRMHHMMTSLSALPSGYHTQFLPDLPSLPLLLCSSRRGMQSCMPNS